MAIITLIFACMLLVASMIDLKHFILPDRFTIGGVIVGITLSALYPELHGYNSNLPFIILMTKGMITALLGAAIGSGLILWIALIGEIIFKKEVMGFGDVKLLGAIGAFCGWKGALFSIFSGALLGCIISIPIFIFHAIKVKLSQKESDGENSTVFGHFIPFGPFLSTGAFAYLLYFHTSFDYYINFWKQLIF